MHAAALFLAVVVAADPAPPPPSGPNQTSKIVLTQAHDSMPGMNMGGMGDMNMGGMGGMAGMAMTPGDIAMGRMAFMNVMGSRAEPGVIMKLLRGFEPQTNSMGSMNGMGSMGAMNMDNMASGDVAVERAKLAPEDRALVNAQDRCPVTGMKLGSMGPPIKIELNGQTVFLCCEHCVEKAKADPQKTLTELARIKENPNHAGMDMGGMNMGGRIGCGSITPSTSKRPSRASVSVATGSYPAPITASRLPAVCSTTNSR